MRSASGGLAAALLLAVINSFCVEGVRAQPVDDQATAEEPEDAPDSLSSGVSSGFETVLFFSGVDLWRNGVFVHDGLLWAPRGLNDDGFVLKLMIGGGLYRYRSGALAADVTGQEFSAAALPGWRFKRGRFTGTVFGGLDLQYHRPIPDDPSSKLRGSNVGLRGGAELWYEPTPNSMIAADLSATSIGPSYSARVALGWRVFDSFYLGPEVHAFAFDNDYRQYRVGAHVTAIKTGPYEWSTGAGWARDSDHRESLYARLGLVMRTDIAF